MSAGLVTAFAGRASAQESSGAAKSGTAAAAATPTQPLQDPTTKYPQPPYPAQTQEWPGLASKMDPKPDHGEESYKGSGRLAGRKALITGGDSGMGRAAAIAYAREGADVAINYLPQEESDAKEVVALIEAEGRKAVALPGDLKDRAFCSKLIEDASRELGGLDIFVSNAARQQARESLEDISDEDFDATFKTNVYAMFWLTKAALQHLKPGSSIIITTSVVAYDPPDVIMDYAMTKACGRNFVQSLAKQLAPKGIRVNGVAPGPIWTPLQPSGGQLPEDLPQFGADTPLGRAGQPGELAGIYVLLASNENSFATGQVYGAVGGNGGP
ncbi:SDR family oxidoreductase [Tianweitania sp. BSSL-BM11]|uniref:SDR family oxidoreductase n=2 Tax=Tianweitania aestuarii TaxID=2814886 RepID=A0ABS5RXX3_9HYPH|nr:SDR family oxidoreductase [Tianweitania aestuarii]